ncbi:MAG: DNA translocase FtsK [Candidatus Riflebacteria bacterium]
MSNKKILLPETQAGTRRTTRKPRAAASPAPSSSRSRRNSNAPLPFNVSDHQRNEAIGLIMIGFSAFSVSLIHYLSSSKIPGLVNYCMVHLGIGVYIIPGLVSLMGIQKFLERPFENLSWRIAGSIGVIIFGLGLLGLEGGKIGVYAMSSATGIFGPVPSKILFFFMLMSSLIFALDILYKDLLAAGVVLISLATRLFFFLWEITLTLLAMLIDAVKTTSRLTNVIFDHIRTAVQQQADSQKLGKLLSFRPRMSGPEEEKASEPLISKPEKPESPTANKIPQVEAEEATIIPEPRNWQKNLEENSAPVESNGVTAFTVQVNQIHGTNVFPASSELNVFDLKEEKKDKACSAGTLESDGENSSEEDLRVMVDFEDDEDDIEDNIAASQDLTEEDVDYDETIYLEDNRIDEEIKNASNSANVSAKHHNPYSDSQLPPLELLRIPPPRDNRESQSDLSQRSALLLKTLEEFGIKASIVDIIEGPAVSRFELKPAPGVKVSRITGLCDDIALALAAQAIRIEAPIPGKPALGIEIPNPNPTPVYFYDLLKSEKFNKNSTPLQLALGVTISGKPVFSDLSEMPHLLIAGSTGSGKSVCVNTIIASILYQARADQVKFIMIDPKMVELSTYNGIPHLISPVVTDPAKASAALMWAVEEMERRYAIMAECGVRKISTYNEELDRLKKDFCPDLEPMPFIVIIIDELADLMMTASAEVEGSICRLAQMARAVGIHLIIATQRPSVNVLTGIIKANLPTRIAFSVASAIDSRTILDAKGAESLLGKGDMLFIPKGRNKPLRLQGAFISDRELMDITEFVKSQGAPEYLDIAPDKADENDDDDDEDNDSQDKDSALVNKIVKYLETQEKTSTSMLQRKFSIGYNRAARIMDQLEESGLVSPMDGSNKRRVLMGRSNSQI